MLGVATRTVKAAIFIFLTLSLTAFGQQREFPLPRGSTPLSELAVTSKGALVATLLSVGHGDPGSIGAWDYQSHWKVVKTLRGADPSELDLSFRVQLFPDEDRERPPTVGQTYILLTYAESPTAIACIFPHTTEKLREIEQLLEAKRK
jgi:hypothetical protein